MQTRRLGRTEIDISLLSIGGLYTSSLGGGENGTRDLLQMALDHGINAIDTAPAYADSEATVGQALKGIAPSQADKLIITTKLGGRPQPFNPQDIDSLRESVHESLRLLGREHIDILMIHEPDRPLQYNWWSNYAPLEGPVLELMDELKQAGKIRYTGLAGTTVNEMCSLMDCDYFDVVLTAFNYNVLFRDAAEELIPKAKEKDMGIVSGSAFGQGFLTKRADDEVRAKPMWLSQKRQQQLLAYYQFLDDEGMSTAEACLRFVMGNPDIATIPIGCKSERHLGTALDAVSKGALPQEAAQRLDGIAAMLKGRPFEEPMILPLGKDYFGPGIANMGAAVQVGKLALQES